MTYKIKIHLAQGVTASIDNISKHDADQYAATLKQPNAVITHTFAKTGTVQLIPVRNILAVEIEEEHDNGKHL